MSLLSDARCRGAAHAVAMSLLLVLAACGGGADGDPTADAGAQAGTTAPTVTAAAIDEVPSIEAGADVAALPADVDAQGQHVPSTGAAS